MADKKISQLSSASTPLAGTEVLPIVQSSTTVKVSADDLTVKNVRSNATTGILQIAGPAAAATRVMTVPDANFTSARTDAAQTFTGNQTLGTGNLVVGTAGKGIDFSANANAPGMTSELLSWYEEGTFTPAYGGLSGGAIAYTTQTGSYTRVGRQVTAWFQIVVNTNTHTTGNATIALPFAANAAGYAGTIGRNTTSKTDLNHTAFFLADANIFLYDRSGGVLSATQITNGCQLTGTITYFA